MLQAEIAGRTTPSADGYPAESHIIRDFCVCSSEGQEVLLSRYRGHSNMVLVFAGNSDFATDLRSSPKRHQRALVENETRVLAIVAGAHQRPCELKHALHLDFEVLVDVDGSVHRSMGAKDQLGHLLPAVFVTDRSERYLLLTRMAMGRVCQALRKYWVGSILSIVNARSAVLWNARIDVS